MKKLAILLVILLAGTVLSPAYGKKDGQIAIVGNVYESMLNTRLPGAMVYLLDSAGAVIDSVKAGGQIQYGHDIVKLSKFSFSVPRRNSSYSLEVEYPGYESYFRVVTLDNIGSREVEREIPDIIMKKEPRRLGEVTVTATKVKFFNKGDTLVYNADAFQLAEGSMLDALIEQMPGVELKDDGQIFVNGKFVESLMLNGKEFMGENNKLMLENLGAYTVKNIAVYDKKSDQNQYFGTDDGDTKFVMDVKLKKEYDNGYVGNLEAGYGSRGRYMGRLFGLKYNAVSQFMVYGNINNLNDKRTPGRNSSWSPEDMQSGSRKEKLIGIDYSVGSADGGRNFSGNTVLTHTGANDDLFSETTNFFPGGIGENYTYAFRKQHTRNLRISTRNMYRQGVGNLWTSVDLNGTYQDNNDRTGVVAGTFNDQQEQMTRSLLENIYSTASGPLGSMVNRNLQTDSTSGKSYSVGGGVLGTYRLPKSSDMIVASARLSYNGSTPQRYNDQTINYGSDPTPAHRLSQYAKNNPAHTFSVKTELNYMYWLTNTNYFQPIYTFTHEHRVKNSYLYALDRLADNGIFGVLPADYQSALDSGNSYEGTHRLDKHTVGFRSEFMGEKWLVQLGPTLELNHQSLDYHQGGKSFHITRNTMAYGDFYTGLTLCGGKGSGLGRRMAYERKLQLSFSASTRLPELEYLIDMPNTADPLFIYEGAPDLKNEQTWKWNLRYDLKPSDRRLMESIVADYNLTTNALVRGYSYDESTGVRRIRSYNTSGNWDAGLANILSTPIDRKGRVMLSSNTAARYGHATDMIGVNSQAPAPFTVKNLLLSENLKLSWNVTSKVNLGAKGDIQWRETRSAREDFQNIHALTANYGVTATAQLPLNFAVSTDVTLYTRSGYSIKELNTTDCVWNARLSYAADKGRWLFMVDGFDLLHQLSAVNYDVTPQGRTVTYMNVLPRFFMVHVQYKFDILPKKR